MDKEIKKLWGSFLFALILPILIILKLIGLINWNWWLVFIPIWGSVLFICSMILIAFCLILARDNIKEVKKIIIKKY